MGVVVLFATFGVHTTRLLTSNFTILQAARNINPGGGDDQRGAENCPTQFNSSLTRHSGFMTHQVVTGRTCTLFPQLTAVKLWMLPFYEEACLVPGSSQLLLSHNYYISLLRFLFLFSVAFVPGPTLGATSPPRIPATSAPPSFYCSSRIPFTTRNMYFPVSGVFT